MIAALKVDISTHLSTFLKHFPTIYVYFPFFLAQQSEKLKHFISTRHKRVNLNDPQAALFRDGLAMMGNYVSHQSSTAAVQSENEMHQYAYHQLDVLEDAVRYRRCTHFKLMSMLHDTEQKQSGLMRELEEKLELEKRKHEHDTAQGDDIT